jgi:hypothetical protein
MAESGSHKVWQQQTGETIDSWFNRETPTVIILDETQRLYRYPDDHFWQLIKSVDGKPEWLHIKVFSCCFCWLKASGRLLCGLRS